jgi:hypothetical protein
LRRTAAPGIVRIIAQRAKLLGLDGVASDVSMRVLDAYAAAMFVAYLLLAAPAVAAFLFWGAWGWVAAAAVVAAVEFATLRRSKRFSARVWRSVGMGQRGRRERGTESIYLISAAVGVALLVGSLLGIG